MAQKVGALEIDIRAAIADLKRDFSQAKAESQKLAGDIGRSNQLIAKSFGAASSAVKGFVAGIAAIGVGGAIAGLAGLIRSTADAAGNMVDLSEKVGLTLRTIQALQFGALETGIAFDQVEAGLAKFAQTVGDAAAENDAAIASFDALDIKLLDADRKLRPLDDLLRDFMGAIAGIDDASVRASRGADVMGKGFVKLAPIFLAGADGLQRFDEEARRLGLTLDEQTIGRIDKAGERFDVLTTAIGDNLKRAITVAALPALESLNSALMRTLELVGSSGGLVGKIRELDLEWSASIRRSFADTIGNLPGMGFLEDEAREAEGRLAEFRANQRRLAAEAENAQPAGEPLRITVGARNPVGSAARKQAIADQEKATRDLIAATRDLDAQERALEGATDGLYALEMERARTKRELGETMAEEIERNAQLLAALQLGTDEYERQRAVVEELAKYKRAGIQLTEEERQAIEAQSRTLGDQRRQIDQTIEAEREQAEIARDLTKIVGKATEDAILSGAKASDVARAAIEDFRRVLLRAFVTKPIQAWGEEIVKQIARVNNTPIDIQARVNGGSGGGGFGGLIGTIGKVFGGLFGGGGDGGDGWSNVASVGFTGAGAFAGAFADGGSFTVGGRAGVDQNRVMMDLTRGERVDISPANDRGGGGATTVYIDARGATQDAVAGIMAEFRKLNASVERRAIAAVADQSRRRPAYRKQVAGDI